MEKYSVVIDKDGKTVNSWGIKTLEEANEIAETVSFNTGRTGLVMEETRSGTKNLSVYVKGVRI